MFHLTNIKYKNILDINELVIPASKVTCILGESGAGKSTLLKLLNKIISFDSGEIFYEGKPISEINAIELRHEVVMLPQTPTIYPGSIKDNLFIGLEFANKPAVTENKLKEILDFINLNKELNDDASKLSGGEKQRLALARVLLLNPKVFLLDEPSSALDDTTAELIIDKLVEYTKNNHKTLIMVTHSKTIANTFADQIIHIGKGKII